MLLRRGGDFVANRIAGQNDNLYHAHYRNVATLAQLQVRRKGVRTQLLWACAVGFLLAGERASFGQRFRVVTVGPTTERFFISSDGQTVVGAANDPRYGALSALRWTPQGGLVFLEDVPGGIRSGRATDCSADGVTVIGAGFAENRSNVVVRWTGLVPTPIAFNDSLLATGCPTCTPRVSANGMTIVAYLDLLGIESGLYSSVTNGVWTRIPEPPSSAWGRQSLGVSSDGSRIVSSFSAGSDQRIAIVVDGTVRVLPELPGGAPQAFDAQISGDGLSVVGASSSFLGVQAFRWREETGTFPLGEFRGELISSASGVNADGSVIVGATVSGIALWWSHGRAISIDERLAASGIDLSNTLIFNVHDVSDDGRFVVGTGRLLPLSQQTLISWWADLGTICPADWNADSGVDSDDVIQFFFDWDRGRADFNMDGGTDADDVIAFFGRWDAGC